MSLSGRKRASLVLLLVLAAGLAAAGGAAAAGAQEMACCPAGMVESGCTWLGASDCCSERPTAPAPTQAATSAPAGCGVSTLTAVPGALLALPASAILPPAAPRHLVLRL